MTGTGTQTDPYIITTAEDLYQMESLGVGGNKYFSLGNDIDFNDTAYAESFIPIPMRFYVFDGCGYAIRNIRYSNPSGAAYALKLLSVSLAGNTMTMKNVRFENIYLSGNTAHVFSGDSAGGTLSVTNCSFSANLTPTSEVTNGTYGTAGLMNDCARIISYDLCSFRIAANLKAVYPILGAGSVNRSQFILDMNIVEASDAAGNAVFCSTSLTDCYIFGEIKATGSEEINPLPFVHNVSANNSYQAVKYSGIPQVSWESTFGGVCFYDADVAGDTVVSSSSALLYGLTTEQCKSAEYLKSIGFVVEEEV